MNPSRMLLKLVLDAIGQQLDLSSFDDRLRLQKAVYLTQLTGLDMAYRFGWYLHGPYSKELTADLFGLSEDIREIAAPTEGYQLGPLAKQLTQKASVIWDGRPSETSESDWMELLASLHYLTHIAYMKPTTRRTFENVFSSLAASKKRFAARKAEAKAAWTQLDRVGLIKQKTMPTE